MVGLPPYPGVAPTTPVTHSECCTSFACWRSTARAALGVPPGPAFGAMLTTLRNAVLDGIVPGRTQAQRFVRERPAAQE